ncbi:MAG: hypothetical protein ACI4AQ_03375 [Lachnospiraceae bacterium]
MEWYKNLYLGEMAARKKYKLLRKINKRWLSKAYIITLPSNEENVLDIYSYNEILQHHYDENQLFVIGLAHGKEEALELTKNIVFEVYRACGNVNVTKYIRQMEETGTT